MNRRLTLFVCLSAIAAVATIGVRAQYTAPPESFSVTETNSMFGPAQKIEVDRDGSKAVVQTDISAATPNAAMMHHRTYYDLSAHRSFSWDPTAPNSACGDATFSGDWGDPFASSTEMLAGLKGQQVQSAPPGPMNGINAVLMTMPGPGPAAGMRAWVETKYGLLVRVETPQHAAILEVTKFTVGKPAAAAMTLPASCAALASTPVPPTESRRIATATGLSEDAFVNAIMPPASAAACTAQFKIQRAGTSAAMTSGFAVGLDLSQTSPGGYLTRVGADGTTQFSGGAMANVTSQFVNGALALANVPPHFQVDVEFGAGGSASALIYRQCFQPRTTLLLVVHNPAKLSDGADWLWLKK